MPVNTTGIPTTIPVTLLSVIFFVLATVAVATFVIGVNVNLIGSPTDRLCVLLVVNKLPEDAVVVTVPPKFALTQAVAS